MSQPYQFQPEHSGLNRLSKSAVADQRAAIGALGVADIQAASTWAEIYARTTDPLIAGQLWNNAGHLVFSSGVLSYLPSTDFSDARNSQYIPLIFQDI